MFPSHKISLENLAARNIDINLLIVDDEKHVLSAVSRQLAELPIRVFTAENIIDAQRLLETQTINIALVDYQLGDSINGLEFLARMNESHHSCFRIIFTGEGDFSFAVESINHGHIDAFLAKPWSQEQLQTLIRQGGTSSYLRNLNSELTAELASQNLELEQLNHNLEEIVADRTEELAQTNQRLHVYQDEMVLLETQAAISELVRGLAHELNNPLGIILGHAQRLQRHHADLPKISEGVGIIEEEVARCQTLINRLRSYAISDDHIEELSHIDPILSATLTRLNQRGVHIPRISIISDIPSFTTSVQTFTRVLEQIISNATAATARNITISHAYKRDRLQLYIDNDGDTPSDDEIRNALKPFFSNRRNATGLGLSIASALLGEHGCTLTFDRHPTKTGTRCTIQCAPNERGIDTATHRQAAMPLSQTQTQTLIVIDDEPLISELVIEVCADMDIECLSGETTQEALTHLQKGTCAAVLINPHLPDGNGCDVIAHIHKTYPHLIGHIALLTGDPTHTLIQKTVQSYSTALLTKPFSMHNLSTFIAQLIQQA